MSMFVPTGEYVSDGDGDSIIAVPRRVVRTTSFRESFPVFFRDVSLTQQQFLAGTDINNIIKRYRVTGLLPQVQSEPLYGDFSELPDYQSALNQVLRAEATFAALSSDLRERFGNDVAAFLDFAADPKNRPDMEKWGFQYELPVDPPISDPAPKEPAKPAPEPPQAA